MANPNGSSDASDLTVTASLDPYATTSRENGSFSDHSLAAADVEPTPAETPHIRDDDVSKATLETTVVSEERSSSALFADVIPGRSPTSSRTHQLSARARSSQRRIRATPRSQQQDHVHVIIRLKPPQRRLPNAYMPYSIDAGCSSARHGERRSELRPPVAGPLAESAPLVKDASASQSAPSTARSAATHAGVSGTTLSLVGNGADGREERRRYEFGEVLDPTVTDAEVCQRLVPQIVEQLAAGFNACILCYGQTGSGKTHTINVIIPALTEAIFTDSDPVNDVVELSYIQIYNNKAYNLLSTVSEGEGHGELLPKPRGAVTCEPKVLVRDAADLLARVKAAQKNRCVSSHSLNARSSRSHTLLSLHMTKCVAGVAVLTTKVTLADLAGSERVKKTQAAGDELEEAIAINKSLLALHAVIKATASEAEVRPFRESLLTLYLAPRIRNWHLFLVVTVSLARTNFSETKMSLDFASIARSCVVSKTRSKSADYTLDMDSDEDSSKRLNTVIGALRDRVRVLQIELAEEKARSAATTASERTEERARRARMKQMERQCATFAQMLKDQEEALSQLESPEERLSALLEAAPRGPQREQVYKLLDNLRSTTDNATVDDLTEYFLWTYEQYNAACEQRRVVEKNMHEMYAENRRLTEEVMETRQALSAWQSRHETAQLHNQALLHAQSTLQRELEDVQLQLYREHTERLIWEETMQLYNGATRVREDEKEQQEAYKEQSSVLSTLQGRMAVMEKELDHAELRKSTLEIDIKNREDTFRSLWALLTPQQKSRFNDYNSSPLDSNGGGSGGAGSPFRSAQTVGSSVALSQGFENVQLRSQVRELRRQLDDALQRYKERELATGDMKLRLADLQTRLQRYETRNSDLVKHANLSMERKEQMEQQIADSLAYIDTHVFRQRMFDNYIRTLLTEQQRVRAECESHSANAERLRCRLEEAERALAAQQEANAALSSQVKAAEMERLAAEPSWDNRAGRVPVQHHEHHDPHSRGDDPPSRLSIIKRSTHGPAVVTTALNNDTESQRKKMVLMNSEEVRRSLVRLRPPGSTIGQPFVPRRRQSSSVGEQRSPRTSSSRRGNASMNGRRRGASRRKAVHASPTAQATAWDGGRTPRTVIIRRNKYANPA